MAAIVFSQLKPQPEGNVTVAEMEDVGNTPALTQLAAAATEIHWVQYDNTRNAAITFLKIWDVAAAPAVGTDAPDAFVFPCPPSEAGYCKISRGVDLVITNGVYVAALTSNDDSATTPPSGQFNCKIGHDST
ncbi:unnamed protein product [marine sediment metagenome]|uniref:Uncharacterized protein n=1 Tax=marine sediment metagenome TaxID=412755 RepID=X0VCJ8_9ZZZZ